MSKEKEVRPMKKVPLRWFSVIEVFPRATVKIIRRVKARTKEEAEAKAVGAPYRVPVMPSRQHDLLVEGLEEPGRVVMRMTRELQKKPRRKACRDTSGECV